MKKFTRKGVTSISTILLVIMTIMICTVALILIVTKDTEVDKQIKGVSVIQDIALKEEKVNYYFFWGVKNNFEGYITSPRDYALGSYYNINLNENQVSFTKEQLIFNSQQNVHASYKFFAFSRIYRVPVTSKSSNKDYQGKFFTKQTNVHDKVYDDIFEYNDGTSEINRYFKFFDSKDKGWAWYDYIGSDDLIWKGVGNEPELKESTMSENSKEFIRSLRGMNYAEGVDLLRQRTLKETGGWFYYPSLSFYWKGKEREYSRDNPVLQDLNLLIEDIEAWKNN